MFRHLTMASFMLRNEKNFASSYTRLMWAVYSREVRGVRYVLSGRELCYGQLPRPEDSDPVSVIESEHEQ